MERFGVALAGLYAIVAAASVSSASADAGNPLPAEGTTTINCTGVGTASASVSRPNTTVTVTCAEGSVVQPSTPAKAGEDVFLGANCSQAGVLSTVCPGGTVQLPASATKEQGSKTANVFFPQLPPSAQVVCLKCSTKTQTPGCTAVINVAAAPPQGPQACAVAGSSVTLRISEAGGSAQFACGAGFALAPKEATKAYADDCTKEETLKDMTRSPTPEKYFSLKVEKLKKKKMCYLCKRSADAGKTGAEQDRCTIYVEVSGSIRLYSSFRFGVALLFVAAVLPFT